MDFTDFSLKRCKILASLWRRDNLVDFYDRSDHKFIDNSGRPSFWHHFDEAVVFTELTEDEIEEFTRKIDNSNVLQTELKEAFNQGRGVAKITCANVRLLS